MFSLTFTPDWMFESGFRADGSPFPCAIEDCGGSLEPVVVVGSHKHWFCAKCGAEHGYTPPDDDDDQTKPNVKRINGGVVKPLVASARVHLDASVTLSVDFERATPEAFERIHDLLFWAERNAETRRGYSQGARFGWIFAKVGDDWTVATSQGHTAAKLVATKLVKPRRCASCRAAIVKGERCYAEGRDQPFGCKQHQNARWCAPCVERTAREPLPENVVRLNARRKAPR